MRPPLGVVKSSKSLEYFLFLFLFIAKIDAKMDVFASYVDEDELNDSEEERVEEAVVPSFDASSAAATLLPLSVDLAPSVTPILVRCSFA
jgi:hypothetical protein